MKLKLHIIGGPGIGKTWIAHQLAGAYNVPAFDLDDIFWDKKAQHYGIKDTDQSRDGKIAGPQDLRKLQAAEAAIHLSKFG